MIPPGRLRTRAMVQGAADKAAGRMSKVEPWRKTIRRHVDDPTLTVGVIVDISGSMGAAMDPMAVSAWVLSEAVKRVQGKCAMAYYGNSVFPTLKPGQHLEKINVYSAEDGTEKFNSAFKAIDGALELLHGTGARLLVIVSDCHYTIAETAAAQKWVAECEKNGVAVLILDPREGSRDAASLIVKGSTKTQIVRLTSDTASAALNIGAAAAHALTEAGARR